MRQETDVAVNDSSRFQRRDVFLLGGAPLAPLVVVVGVGPGLLRVRRANAWDRLVAAVLRLWRRVVR